MEVGEHKIQLQKVYYAEAVKHNLFSVKATVAEGASITLGETEAYVTKGNLKINLPRGEDAWYLPIDNKVGNIRSAIAPWGLWHERMGHRGPKKLKSLAKGGYIQLTGKLQERENCVPCLLSKPRREAIPRHATASGENVVQVDIMPWSVKGWKGEKYAVVFSHRKSQIDMVITLNEGTYWIA